MMVDLEKKAVSVNLRSVEGTERSAAESFIEPRTRKATSFTMIAGRAYGNDATTKKHINESTVYPGIDGVTTAACHSSS